MNDPGDFQWLASAQAAEAWALCRDAEAFSPAALVRLGLRRSQIQQLQVQVEFAIGAARRKVSDPWNWFWTKTLLEQASDQLTAEDTARDFPQDAYVVDACCGAGVDAIAIAKQLSQCNLSRGRILAVDSSEVACLLTELNAANNGVALEVQRASFERTLISRSDWLHIDPDRRVDGRTVNLYATEPSWSEIAQRIEHVRGASIKAAPGFQPDGDFQWGVCGPPDTRRWISRDGSVRQQRLYWRVPRWEPAKRVVSVHRRTSGWVHEFFDVQSMHHEDPFSRIVQEPSEIEAPAFIADQDPALRAAHCVVPIAHRLQLRLVGNEFGYCLANSPIEHPMLRWFRVLEMMPLDRKKVRAMTRGQKVKRWELKSRNVDVDLVQWQKDLVTDPGSELVRWLLITKIGKKHLCFVCQECGL
ncbi:MAG: THUMP-like domain-containing protein [Pirellula sp.]